jgi:SAM-dependent methyltransferase
MALPYNKVLNIEDFYCPELYENIAKVLPHFPLGKPEFPKGAEIAKAWELGMTVRAMHDFRVLGHDSEILGVGAGSEATIFYLTNFVKRVFATDLYANPGVWTDLNKNNMLVAPETNVVPPLQWNPRRLVVQHMNALDLKYPDETFDALFSCGSIEHFGTAENVSCAASEMGRVLKSGGICCVTTEFRVFGPEDDLGIPGVILFNRKMLKDLIIDPSGLKPVDNPHFHASKSTTDLAYPLAEAVQNGIRVGYLTLTHDRFAFTSVILVLRKP